MARRPQGPGRTLGRAGDRRVVVVPSPSGFRLRLIDEHDGIERTVDDEAILAESRAFSSQAAAVEAWWAHIDAGYEPMSVPKDSGAGG